MEVPPIVATSQGGVTTLTLKPGNGCTTILTERLWPWLESMVPEQASRPDCRGIVLRVPASVRLIGPDLVTLISVTSTERRQRLDADRRALTVLEQCPVPSIAVIEGEALAGGFEVALACDFRIAVRTATMKIGFPLVRAGLIPCWGGTQRSARLVGVEEALDRLLSGECYEWNDPPPEDLVDSYVAPDEVAAAVDRLLAEGDWHEMRRVKRSPVSPDLLPTAEYLEEIRSRLSDWEPTLQPTAAAIVRVVLEGALSDLHAGLEREAEAFLGILNSPLVPEQIDAFLRDASNGWSE
ncbi:MAG: enoyl-CoA hydratase-related protein [Nitrospira sp.]|nr:enoyl-CoA hydratase-related protein [Nitrospira sp.]